MGSTEKTKITIPHSANYSQLHQLLSVATDCIKSDRKRIAELEKANAALLKRIEALEAAGIGANTSGLTVQTFEQK